jgi:hypothetical protein
MLTGEKEEGLRSQRRTVVVGAVPVPEARVLDVGRREHEGEAGCEDTGQKGN